MDEKPETFDGSSLERTRRRGRTATDSERGEPIGSSPRSHDRANHPTTVRSSQTAIHRKPPRRPNASETRDAARRRRRRIVDGSGASVSSSQTLSRLPCSWTCSITYPCALDFADHNAGKSIPPARKRPSAIGCVLAAVVASSRGKESDRARDSAEVLAQSDQPSRVCNTTRRRTSCSALCSRHAWLGPRRCRYGRLGAVAERGSSTSSDSGHVGSQDALCCGSIGSGRRLHA